MNEVFKSINGYDGIYNISNFGNIISLKRKGVCNNRVLKLTNHKGYITCLLSKNKKPTSYHLHRLLFKHFKGSLIDGFIIDHIDNNKTNNSLDNLQQITIRENTSKDRFRHKSSSDYLGVGWCKIKKKWRAVIYNGTKRKHIGYYEDEIEASNAYKFEKELLLIELNKEIKYYD